MLGSREPASMRSRTRRIDGGFWLLWSRSSSLIMRLDKTSASVSASFVSSSRGCGEVTVVENLAKASGMTERMNGLFHIEPTPIKVF